MQEKISGGKIMLELVKQISKKPRVAGTNQGNKVKDFLIKKLEVKMQAKDQFPLWLR